MFLCLLGTLEEGERVKLQPWSNVKNSMDKMQLYKDRQSRINKYTIIVLILVPCLIMNGRAALPFGISGSPNNPTKDVVTSLKR